MNHTRDNLRDHLVMTHSLDEALSKSLPLESSTICHQYPANVRRDLIKSSRRVQSLRYPNARAPLAKGYLHAVTSRSVVSGDLLLGTVKGLQYPIIFNDPPLCIFSFWPRQNTLQFPLGTDGRLIYWFLTEGTCQCCTKTVSCLEWGTMQAVFTIFNSWKPTGQDHDVLFSRPPFFVTPMHVTILSTDTTVNACLPAVP